MNELIRQLENYIPENEQEEADCGRILAFLKTSPDPFLRTNVERHMTASAWVVNPDRTKVLMAYHKIYDSWAWLGGHADGEEDLLKVALKEVREEAGIIRVKPVTADIFSLEVLTVDGHEKRGHYVPSHLHYNVTYLLEADDLEKVRVKEDENSGVAWFTPAEALRKSTEPWFVERVYGKLIRKEERLRTAP